jgi:hypothetical protein
MHKIIFMALMAKAASKKTKTLFTSKLNLNLRKKLANCYIALYCTETWTLEKVYHK